jgi:hypothetical protein
MWKLLEIVFSWRLVKTSSNNMETIENVFKWYSWMWSLKVPKNGEDLWNEFFKTLTALDDCVFALARLR